MEQRIKKDDKPAGMPMRGPAHMMQGAGAGEKARNLKGTLLKLVKYLRVYWIGIIFVIVFAIASTVFTVVTPKILGGVTDSVVKDYISIKVYDQIQENIPEGIVLPDDATGKDVISFAPAEMIEQIPEGQREIIEDLDLSKRPEIDFDSITNTILLLLGLYILSLGFSYVQGWIMTNITQKVTYNMRKELSIKLNKIPLRYYDNTTHGEVLSRITNDIDTVGQTLNQSLSQIVTSVTTIIGILIMMISISWSMTLVGLMVLPLSMGLVMAVIKRSQPLFKKQQNSLGEVNGHIEEMYSGHSIMKVFNGEKQSLEKFDAINEKLYTSAWKSQFLSSLMMPIMTFINNLGYVAVSVLGGWYAAQGRISIGDIQAFIQYLQQFNRPIIQTANIANVLQSTAAAAERVFEFLEEEEEVLETDSPIVLSDLKGKINFNNVHFSYDQGEPIIKGFNAEIKPGQRIAIVGPTGAGKTTMVNLLMRFYDVDKGSIEIDDIDIRSMRRTDLREMFGMVLQDTWLFNGTIKENILYGKPDASDEEIQNVAEAAQVDRFIRSLPNGYDMVINEETDNISQGEKQLLTIARAMLADPPMLILDEATSSVDTRTEVLIQKAMDNLMHNRTSFVIAHRLSTIKNADLILVMNLGNIVEQGTHCELLEKRGFYADLYESQFEEN